MTSTTFVSTGPRIAPPRMRPRVSTATTLRVLLVAGSAGAAAAAFLLAGTTSASAVDADLALLLHGMAAIKTSMVAAAVALLAWRFGHPVERRFATGYLVGAFLVCGATAMIWQLVAIMAAALAFHAGTLLLLVVAWRDDGSPLRMRSSTAR